MGIDARVCLKKQKRSYPLKKMYSLNIPSGCIPSGDYTFIVYVVLLINVGKKNKVKDQRTTDMTEN